MILNEVILWEFYWLDSILCFSVVVLSCDVLSFHQLHSLVGWSFGWLVGNLNGWLVVWMFDWVKKLQRGAFPLVAIWVVKLLLEQITQYNNLDDDFHLVMKTSY